MTDNIMPFDSLDSESKSIIKVIGVGGGGGNAVNHMYNEGIEGVTFALCNTDNQALARSSIATKLQLGPNVTRGLGAGSDPAKAKEAAEESIDEIRRLLNDGTEMVFITAGMGGGTGTGAAPVVARVAKEMGILTIGIVTLPFLFEGRYKILQALKGVEAIREHVDALMIINNERLRFIYPDFEFDNAFAKADDTLTVAARSIVEIITIWGPMNLDFADVKRTLEDGGVAIISTGLGEGENRVEKAIKNALHSPLLNDTDIVNAQRVLLNLTYNKQSKFLMEEIGAVHDFMRGLNRDVKVIWGYAYDESLGDSVKITLLASGFEVKNFTGEAVDKIVNEEDEAKRQAEDEEIGRSYGGLIEVEEKAKRHNVYYFTPETLDDENIIYAIEESPTYSRKRAELGKLASLSTAAEETPVVRQVATQQSAVSQQSDVITGF